MGKYLVTQEQWEAVMGNNPSQFKGPKNPMEEVSWDDCQKFLEQLNAKSAAAEKFQLPTEAQWEYACRAGSKTRYCFGDDEKQLGEYAWYRENSGDKTHTVGEKKPNAWGLYDMHGNACITDSNLRPSDFGACLILRKPQQSAATALPCRTRRRKARACKKNEELPRQVGIH